MLGEVFFYSITGIADFEETWIFITKIFGWASAGCDWFGFVTFSLASFDVNRCQFALMMLGFTIFALCANGYHTVVAVTFQDRIGWKKLDAIVRSIADLEVPDVLVCLPSVKGSLPLFKFFFIRRVIYLIFSDNIILYNWKFFYLGYFFFKSPPFSPPKKNANIIFVNYYFLYWPRNIGFV